MNSEAVVRLAEPHRIATALKISNLRAGCYLRARNRHCSCIEEKLPGCADYVDPNGAWLLDEAISLCKGLMMFLPMPKIHAAQNRASPDVSDGGVSAGDRLARRD